MSQHAPPAERSSTAFRFIHAADLHLDSPLRGLARYEGAPLEALRGATREALRNLVQLAIDEAVAFVLIAGDLYDGDWKDYNTGLFLIAQLRLLEAKNIPVIIISGNHDADNVITRSLTLPDNVTRLSTTEPQTLRLDALGVAIHGQGYRRRETKDNLAAAYPAALAGDFNIGLLHTSLTGRDGHAPYAPCTLDELRAKGYDYWALGHVHRREVVTRDPWVVFPGNIQGRHARETGPKGCTLVSVADGEIRAVEHRDLDVLRWAQLQVDASGASSGDEVCARVDAAITAALGDTGGRALAARVTVHGSCEAHAALTASPERWINQIRADALDHGGGEVWVEKVTFATRAAITTDELLARDDALGELLRSFLALEADETAIAELRPLFDDLRAKLPAALTQGADGVDLNAPETLRAAIEGAKELLLAQILGTPTSQGGQAR